MNILVIGSGISGLEAARYAAEKGHHVTIISPDMPERSQSVMAAGGINAALDNMGERDTPELHAEETLKSGKYMENPEAVKRLCGRAPQIVHMLKDMGVLFRLDANGSIMQRDFGGQSKKRTAYAGTSTGKQIVTALSRALRKYRANGSVQHILHKHFLSALLCQGVCYGAMLLDDIDNTVSIQYADAVIMATGGQNRLFGKTTGSILDDGYAAGKLFTQGVTLRNLEFIQYHPTTIETADKRMLVSEAARGEGGRLFYLREDGSRCYFMEEKYGERGNLMPRDVVSKEIYDAHRQVYLDISFLGEQRIRERLQEVRELCRCYIDLDVTKQPIPIAPSVHFFMGGIAVNLNHETNMRRLYAVGECASMYHGANRLGGNSLLAAMYSAEVAVDSIGALDALAENGAAKQLFEKQLRETRERIRAAANAGRMRTARVMEEIAAVMRESLGIARRETVLLEGLKKLDSYTDMCREWTLDGTLSVYESIALPSMLTLARAIMLSARNRRESRGAHIRSDYPEMSEKFAGASFAEYRDGEIIIKVGAES